MQSWKDLNPGWTHKLWTSAEGFALSPLIERSPEWCGKADLMRYEILWREGGVYLDADSECILPLSDDFLLPGAWACFENETVRPGLVANGSLGSVAGHPLFRALMDLAPTRNYSERAWVATGPKLLTEVIESRAWPDVQLFPARAFFPDHHSGSAAPGSFPSYARQHWGTTQGYPTAG
jgi:mannosyltransferase OCH1-like enzyme